MNRKELKNNLIVLGVNDTSYSLDGELLPGRLVLFESYYEWQVFLFDERGSRDQEKIFLSESDACEYLFERLKSTKETEDQYFK